ncbi:MAG TPA: hypothetical protein VJP45_02660 [Candidatus Limnocylindria bacterium]|nr:hypothetical protein [Candidatus Limnocylindria bacterium]
MIAARELVTASVLAMQAPPPVIDAPPKPEPQPQRLDFRASLFDKQQHAWDCTANLRCLLTSRRAGKSTKLALWLLEGAEQQPNGVCVYIAPTQKHARRILWRILVQTARAAWGDRARVYESTMTVITPAGGTVRLGGCDDKAAIAPHVGEPFVRAAVDECGKFPSELLKELVEEALEPATVDYQGQIVLAGTPGLLRTGYWHDLTGPARSMTYDVFHWTLFDNPHIPHARAFVDDLMRRRGWTKETPSYQREYLGQWCEDKGAQVFPLGPQNVIDKLPERSRQGGLLPATLWRYAIGVDIGWTDATAIAVVASHPLDSREFIVGVEKHPAFLVTQLRDRLRMLLAQYGSSTPIVVDSGGMGRYHVGELSLQWQMALEAAQKLEKASHVRDVRDRLLAGRLILLDGPCCDPLREEWAVLGWDEKREKPDGVDHASDAVLYAVRRLWHHNADDKHDQSGSPEAESEREAEAMKARVMNRNRPRVPGRAAWDR